MKRSPGAGRCVARVAIASAAVSIALVAWAGPALAHASIVSSEPEAGARLTSGPGVVVLRFTEPLNGPLSRVTVVDPTGRRFDSTSASGTELRVPLPVNVPGVYEVRWRTVSTLDGHPLHGRFAFGVGVDPGEGAAGSTGTSPGPVELALSLARALEYLALLVAVGMLLVARLAHREPSLPWVRPRLTAAVAIAFAAGVVVVLGEALAASPQPSVGSVTTYMTTGVPGAARMTRLVAEALALLQTVRRRSPALPLGVSLVALAGSGHAAAVEPPSWGIAVDAVHLLSAGLWGGAILAMATLSPPGGWRTEQARALLERFSPVALTAFVLTIGTGVLRGLQELASPSQLLTTSYGQVLSVKVLAVAAMVPLSVLAWRRITGSPRLEAAVGVVVVAAAAVLAAYPLPPGRLAEAETANERTSARSGLPRGGDLTLGGEAGKTLVGLTLRPGRPGANVVYAYVLPLEGEEAAGGVRAHLEHRGRSLEMERCGLTCHTARLDLEGGERVAVRVEGEGGGRARFSLPELPAADASAVLARMQRRMHALRSYRLEETLRPADPALISTYAFEAPDRMRAVVADSVMVQIGDRRFRRESPRHRWTISRAPELDVPTFIWDSRGEFLAPRVLGAARVDGASTTVVSFFTGGGLPIWFRLWIDDAGLVRRAEMRAQGHFMDHRYHAFDAPLSIEPPLGS